MSLELSVSTLAFDGYGFASACEGIAEAGARHVEPAFVASYGPVDEGTFTQANAAGLRNSASAAGLRCVTLSAHVDTGLPDAVEKLKSRLAFAAELGAVRLISNAAVAAKNSMFRRNLPVIAEAARAAGVRVCLENPGDVESVLAGPGQIVAWASEFENTFLGINLDFGNLYTASGGKLRPSMGCADAIAASESFHLKDFAESPAGLQACAIGDGILDYRPILETIVAARPNATAGIEMPLRVFRPVEGDPRLGPVLSREAIVASVAKSVAFVERVSTDASPAFARKVRS